MIDEIGRTVATEVRNLPPRLRRPTPRLRGRLRIELTARRPSRCAPDDFDNTFPFSDRIDFDTLPVADTLVLSLSALLWLVLFEEWLPGLGPAPAGLEAPMRAPGVPEALAAANGFAGVAAYLLMWGR
ncbi:hypothetical protein [Natrinema sp. SYSU A 869]|uniref:hypothetical protein n=1 Tax=Natrinema sp. SYSU A 869 TaxID=2871694 RepID=UPI002102191B|nr:hypothetical protein [Natrinema sp. SYSU A 869]